VVITATIIGAALIGLAILTYNLFG